MGPVSTGLGEIFLWTVEAEDGALKEDGTPYTPTDLRVIQDWIIKPTAAQRPWCCRDQHHRWLRQAVSDCAGPEAVGYLQADT